MPALNQNLSLGANRSAIIAIPILDQDGNAYSLAGGAASWSIAKSPSGPALVHKTTAAGGIVLNENEETGVWSAVITLQPADTNSMEAGTYLHQLSVENSFGNVVTATVGKVFLYATIDQF